MSSPQQIAANQQNAQLSTGPQSQAGKETVSRNAVRHGLAGDKHAVLPGEEDAFEDFARDYAQRYAPVGRPEESLVRALAREFWRLERAHGMEDALFHRVLGDYEASTPVPLARADAFLDPAKGLRTVSAYVRSIQRAIDKISAELKSLQSQRKAAYDKAKKEAMLLTMLGNEKGQKPDATKDFPPPEQAGGFVYCFEEIKAELLRAMRLEEARSRFPGLDTGAAAAA